MPDEPKKPEKPDTAKTYSEFGMEWEVIKPVAKGGKAALWRIPLVSQSQPSNKLEKFSKSVLWILLYCLAALGTVCVFVLLIAHHHITRIPDASFHLARFWHAWWNSFTASVGSNSNGFTLFVLEPPVIFLVSFIALIFVVGREVVKHEKIKTLIAAFGLTFTVTVLLYGPTFVRKGVDTAYYDHQLSIADNKRLLAERNAYQTKADRIPELEEKIKAQEGKPPKVITQKVTVEQEKRCWIASHFGMPNSTIKGAVTATAAIIHCNYKIDAPFRVMVEFDKDFIPGGTVLPSSGVTMIAGTGKNGRVYIGQINSPAVTSDQLVIITVYGETDQYPRPVRYKIEAIQ